MPSESVYRYPFSPYPTGWYQIGWSDELAVGDVKPIRVFGRDLVLFRTEGGEAVLLDAHCPHMGAHLGEGGAVVGDSLRCPFHFWRFGSDGRCVEAPYERRGRTPDTGVRRWPLHESSGLLLVGRAPDQDEPTWRMPEIPEWTDEAWGGYEKRIYRVRMHVQELAENVPDAAHFLYVHETNPMPKAIGEIEGEIYRQKTAVDLGEGAEMAFYQTLYGLGLIWLRNEDAGPKTLFLTAPTPVDEQNVDIRVSYLFKQEGPRDAATQFLELMDGQFEADTRIWENKVYAEKPHLIDGDGPIAELRRWATQFYVGMN